MVMEIEDDGRWSVRRLLLIVVMLGIVGLSAELYLLEHTETIWQWAPFVVLGVGLLSTMLVAARPNRFSVRAFQAIMALFVVTGILGLYLHYDGNAAFELEMDDSLQGMNLIWNALRGATPALAPGALVQLGLLGLIQAYRHPAVHNLNGRRP